MAEAIRRANALAPEYIPQLNDLTHLPLAIEDGYAIAPDAPGLGIDWNFKAVNERAVARCRIPNN